MNKKHLRKTFAFTMVIWATSILPSVTFAAGLINFDSQPEGFSKLVEKVSSAVVNINTTTTVAAHPLQGVDPLFDQYFKDYYKNNPHAPGQKETNYGLGSGFIVSEDGKIITNNHVIRGADDIYVSLENGDQIEAKILGVDEKIDIAILQLVKPGKYPFLEFGSSDKTKVGDWAIAMGNPLGLGKTVTAGIISAKERNIKIGPYDNFIQTDASINPGNSGGPLFNIEGKVIGVNTAIIGSAQGLGFAVPIDTANHVYQQIITTGHVQRGWMGISLVELSPEDAKQKTGSPKLTTYVAEVVAQGPAAQAGLRAGDILTHLNDKEIEITSAVPRLIANELPGTIIKITYLRAGKSFATNVKLGDQDNPNKSFIYPVDQTPKAEIIGIDVRDIEAADKIPQSQGAYISFVHPDTIAKAVGLQVGDVVVEMNGTKIINTQTFAKELANTKKGSTVTIKAYRKNALMNFAFRK